MIQAFTNEEPSSFETLGSQFSILGVVPNWDPKPEFSMILVRPKNPSCLGLKNLDPVPWASQISPSG